MFLAEEYCSIMSHVVASGLTQLRRLEPKSIPKLLPLSIKSGYWKPQNELEKLWQYINRYYSNSMDLTEWQGLSLIPILSEDQKFSTSCINSSSPVLSSDGMNGDVCQWLKKEFGIRPASPMHYLKHWLGSKYILNPNMPRSVLLVIYQVWSKQPNVVVSAVQKAHSQSPPCFKWFEDQVLIACTQSFDQNLHKFVIELPIFCPVKGTAEIGRLISAEEASCYYFKEQFKFEIKRLLGQIGFPFPLISFDSNSTLIGKLNLKEMSIADFVSKLMCNIIDPASNKKTVETVVSWLVRYYEELKKSSVKFDNLSSHLVFEQFKTEVQDLIINRQPKYSNFCTLLQSAPKAIWTKIRQLNVIPCANNHLHCSAELVISCGFKNTCPYVCQPAEWVKSKCEKFLSNCLIREKLSLDGMVNIVRCIQKDHTEEQKPLDEKTTLKGFLEVLDEIAKLSKNFEQVKIHELKLQLPDSMGYLQPVDSLFYDDISVTDQHDSSMVHKTVRRDIAIHFGTKTLRDVLLEKYEDHEEFGEEFGQEIDLVVRIKRLLEQYHTQSDIFQEFLQNADDARATKIAFFLDKRSHTTKGLLSEKYEELQDSAILIYNDSTFTEDDIKGIQQLGVGSKADDAEKIGRFGAGFNCAYRYTDCPTFISDDDVLCVFDPMQQFLKIPESKRPGRKFKLHQETHFQFEFPAVYNTYQIDGFPLSGGTMFRLPLRKVLRTLSLDELHSVQEVSSLFKKVADNMKKMMLFLRNVTDVSAYESDSHGKFGQLWRFQLETTESTWMTKEEFGCEVHKYAKSLPSEIPVIQSSYELIIGQKNKLHQEKWCVCQRLGFDKLPEAADFSKVKLLPVAGVATQLDNGSHKHSLFCSLPLPQTTEMPVSINGHFSLDSESRKNLFTTVEGELDDREDWNATLLNVVAINSYLDLLEVLKMNINDKFEGLHSDEDNLMKIIREITTFWELLPDIQTDSLEETTSAWPRRMIFSNNLFKMLAKSDRCLFPCLAQCNGRPSIDWLNLSGNLDGPLFPSHSSFQLVPSDKLKDAFLQLYELGIKICPCPPFILKAFANASVDIQTAKPSTVASYLKEPWINLTTGNQKLPCPLTDTVFQSEKKVLSLLKFLLESTDLEEPDEVKKSNKFHKYDEVQFNLIGLPLLVTCDNFLRYFSTANPAKLERNEDIIGLFSEHSNRFVCKKLRDTVFGYLKQQHEDATVAELNLEDLYMMLPGEMHQQGINSTYDTNKLFCNYPPNKSFREWLLFLWCLIVRLTTGEDGANQFASLFKIFYLIPAKMSTDGPLFLFRIDTRLQIVQPDMWGQISEIILKGLPIVDIQGHFPNIRSSFFGPGTPDKLIDCLIFWNQLGYLNWPSEIQSHRDIAYDLLTYFAKNSKSNVNNLRNLPIFETFDGKIKQLVVPKVFTLETQENLPPNGQLIWMSKAFFLKKHDNPKITCLYKELHIGHIDLQLLYTKFILPSFPDMTTVDQVAHLHYLNNCPKGKGFQDALQILREIQFIQDNNGSMKSINQFYDHTVQLFTEMCCKDEFLPQYFFEALKTVDDHWLKGFLLKLGLKHIPEPEDHVKFALQLSQLQLPLDTNLEKIERVSKLLLDSVAFLTTTVSESMLARWSKSIAKLSNIAFIPSKKFNESFRSLYPSTTLDSVQLLKANGSFSSVCQSLVWTVSRVLPDWVPQRLFKKMGIITFNNEPCLYSSVEHFQKLLGYLFLAKLQQQTDDGVNCPTSRDTLKIVLDDFYRFLDRLHNKGTIDNNYRMKLMKMPLIVVEDGRHLTSPEISVERLPTENLDGTSCYAPFMYELPHLLHKYEDLFRFLRMQQKPCVWHYVMYLHYVHKYLPEDGPKLDPNLRKSILSVQKAMVTSADKTIDWDDVENVYLFSSDGKLHRSSELVFRDGSVNTEINLPENNSTLKFWECSPNPDSILLMKMAEFVESLPDQFKLKLSSEVLIKSVSVEKSKVCQYDQPCPALDRLKTLLSSSEFLESIQRIYSVENNTIDPKDDRKWDEIHEKLQSIQIQCYSKLIIELKDMEHSEVIENTDEECESFFDVKRMHMSHEVPKIELACNLAGYIQQFLSMKLREMALCALFLSSEPCDLRSTLDKLHVPALAKESLHVSNLPIVGRPVPADLIHFLEMHPKNYFRNGEYVAFLKSDEDAEDDPMHSFVWAKIICCVDDNSASALYQHYKINVGDSLEPIIVSALDLHKFITQSKSSVTASLVPTDIEGGSQPIPQIQNQNSKDLTEEEACSEVTQILEEARNLPANEYQKVIRRLYLTWHPDKNTEDKKALSTNVFQHLQSEIQRLQNDGTAASETFTNDQSFHAWDFFRSNTNQTWNDYTQGHSQTPFDDFDFHTSTQQENPDPIMAKKYWQTANDDLKSAFDSRQCQKIDMGKDIGNEHIIILAQQAVEKALKAALYAEIGTAEQNHNLIYFAQRVANKTRCSNDIIRKVSNFVSECGVDLTRLRYPDGQRPHITYTESQADKAVDYAVEIMEDLGKAFPAFEL